MKLARHANIFGQFSLEFDIASIRQLGGLPVTYLPMPRECGLAEDVGFFLALGVSMLRNELLVEEMHFSDPDLARIFPPEITASDRRWIEDWNDDNPFDAPMNSEGFLKRKHRSLKLNLNTLNHFLSICYPTERRPTDEALQYFRQREWRIVPHLLPQSCCVQPTYSQAAKLVSMDSKFFGRSLGEHSNSTASRVVDSCLFFKGVGSRSLVTFVRRVFAPHDCVTEVKSLIAAVNPEIEVVPFEKGV